jgi:alpha-tubulin suppressor-like RCC1 family protein
MCAFSQFRFGEPGFLQSRWQEVQEKQKMSALDVLRQIKLSRKTKGAKKIIEWGNAEHITEIGVENLSRKDLRNHLEARDLETAGTRLELIERLRISISDEQLHKFAYQETQDAEFLIQADLEERGSVYVCGKNDKGQLGVGDIHSRKLMTVIPQMRGVSTRLVAASADLTYALTEDFTVFVWGGGGVGRTAHNPKGPRSRLGSGGQPNWMEPSVVFDLSGEECIQVAIGASHCLACAQGGDCFVWGDGTCGQLGLGHFDNHPTIAINNSFSGILQVSCGSNHSVALTKGGEVISASFCRHLIPLNFL